MKWIALIAVLAFWTAQAFAEEGNYLLGPIEDAPIEIDVPEVSQDGRPAGVPAEAKKMRFNIRRVQSDTLGIEFSGLVYGPQGTLYGIDAPERDQPYWLEAAKALRYMLLSDPDLTQVGVVYVVEVTEADRKDYASVQLYHATEGYDINASLVCAGYAWWDRERAPDSKILSDCETEARAKRLGIWSERNPIPPWEWRRGVRPRP